MSDEQGQKPPSAKPEPPLENPKVDVSVVPKERHDASQKEYAARIKKAVESDVEKAIEKAKPGGAVKQLEAAEKVADDAKKKVDAQKVARVRVKVEGDVDGDKVSREKVVVPKGG